MSLQQLEFLDDPLQFEEGVRRIKKRVHHGNYNRSELLNVWRKLTLGLRDPTSSCEPNIKCLLAHHIEFLNYHHDNEPMVQLLTYGSTELIDAVVSTFPVEKLIGFRNEHEPKLSLAQDLNLNCPLMNGLELFRKSKGAYNDKMNILLKYASLQFTLKYISNHTLYFSTPLAHTTDPLVTDYIKLHGGTLEYQINEPLSNVPSYYQFFKVNAVNLPLLEYLEQVPPRTRRTKKITKKNGGRTRKHKRKKNNPYIVVGGVGGSGTRVIASMLASLGLNIGTDLNEAYDNLSFTLLYKDLLTLNMNNDTFEASFRILANSIIGTRHYLTEQDNRQLEELCKKGRPGHPRVWLQERVKNIHKMNDIGPLENPYLKELPQLREKPLDGKWGWKEPNSHILMNRLEPSTKFIMVVRNGLDMAFSTNQNQTRLWGPMILPEEMQQFDHNGHILYTPRVSMKYWTLVHQKVLQESKAFRDNFLMVNFDELCLHPEKWLRILCDFLKIEHSVIPEMRHLVYKPDGIGRYKKEDLSQIDPSDILFAKQLGFDVE